MKLKNLLGSAFNNDVLTTLNLIEVVIKPILLFTSELWGCMKLPKSTPIENLHMMMCKQLLGVQKQTTHIGVLLELGRVPMQLFAVKFAIKNWERIKQKKENMLLMLSYSDAMKENLQRISTIREYLGKNGMLSLFINSYENKPLFIHKKLFQTLSDTFHQNAFETINNDKSKLRTYARPNSYGRVKTRRIELLARKKYEFEINSSQYVRLNQRRNSRRVKKTLDVSGQTHQAS